jgi:hypothetical protein
MKAKDRTNNPSPVSLKNESLHKLCGVYNSTSRLVQKKCVSRGLSIKVR